MLAIFSRLPLQRAVHRSSSALVHAFLALFAVTLVVQSFESCSRERSPVQVFCKLLVGLLGGVRIALRHISPLLGARLQLQVELSFSLVELTRL